MYPGLPFDERRTAGWVPHYWHAKYAASASEPMHGVPVSNPQYDPWRWALPRERNPMYRYHVIEQVGKKWVVQPYGKKFKTKKAAKSWIDEHMANDPAHAGQPNPWMQLRQNPVRPYVQILTSTGETIIVPLVPGYDYGAAFPGNKGVRMIYLTEQEAQSAKNHGDLKALPPQPNPWMRAGPMPPQGPPPVRPQRPNFHNTIPAEHVADNPLKTEGYRKNVHGNTRKAAMRKAAEKLQNRYNLSPAASWILVSERVAKTDKPYAVKQAESATRQKPRLKKGAPVELTSRHHSHKVGKRGRITGKGHKKKPGTWNVRWEDGKLSKSVSASKLRRFATNPGQIMVINPSKSDLKDEFKRLVGRSPKKKELREFSKAYRHYVRFHGQPPRSLKKVKVDGGKSKFVVGVGELEKIDYSVPFDSERADTYWTHEAGDHGRTGPKTAPPFIVHDPRVKTPLIGQDEETKMAFDPDHGLIG